MEKANMPEHNVPKLFGRILYNMLNHTTFKFFVVFQKHWDPQDTERS